MHTEQAFSAAPRYVTESGEYKWGNIISDGAAAAAAAWTLFNNLGAEEKTPPSREHVAS